MAISCAIWNSGVFYDPEHTSGLIERKGRLPLDEVIAFRMKQSSRSTTGLLTSGGDRLWRGPRTASYRYCHFIYTL